MHDIVSNEYFEWLCTLITNQNINKSSYRKLLAYLHTTPFRYVIPRDENRAEDGMELRYRFAYEGTEVPCADSYLDGPCSVLEMMVALTLKCEETIMDDPSVGDRTRQWFWNMITNLGLGTMSDDNYDKRYVIEVVNRFLDRDYEPNGRGGLFFIRNTDTDLRGVEIWHQLCWYLDSIV